MWNMNNLNMRRNRVMWIRRIEKRPSQFHVDPQSRHCIHCIHWLHYTRVERLLWAKSGQVWLNQFHVHRSTISTLEWSAKCGLVWAVGANMIQLWASVVKPISCRSTINTLDWSAKCGLVWAVWQVWPSVSKCDQTNFMYIHNLYTVYTDCTTLEWSTFCEPSLAKCWQVWPSNFM